MIRVLGVSGSPHRRGNTETLLDAFLEGAREAGADVEKVVLSTLEYGSCRGCNACHRNGTCVLNDDAVPLFERMAGADVLAVASPIYSMGVTAELKGLIDRAQYLWARRFVTHSLEYSLEHLARHQGVFLATAGSDWPGVPTIKENTEVFRNLPFSEEQRAMIMGGTAARLLKIDY